MSMAGLPRNEFRKTENIHFISTSNVVPSVALGKSIARDLQGIIKRSIDITGLFEIVINVSFMLNCCRT
jgi:hypothetical protein